jgi:GTP-binding protein HflX
LNKEVILVFNKIDQLKEPFVLGDETIENKQEYILQLKKSWMAKENYPAIFISAAKKINTDELKAAIIDAVEDVKLKIKESKT